MGKEFTVHAPFDGTPIKTLETIDWPEVDRRLATAHALYRNRDAWIPAPKRIQILHKAAAIMRERSEAMALSAAREGGKPLMDSRVELARAIDGVENCIEVLRSEQGRVVPMNVNAASAGRYAFTRREPIGVVVAVSAFNHPLNLVVHQVAPALAAGCPVLVKPAAATPLSCIAFLDILYEAGLPLDWCQLALTANSGIATQMVGDPRVAFFSFIGSARIGWMLRSKLAPGARCALEHGGVAPVILAADADLDDALPRIAKGGFYHAGQVCVSVQRVFADASVARSVAERLGQLADKMVVGDPTDAKTEVGPLINHDEVKRVDEWVKEAVEAGAKLVAGGKVLSPSTYAPTVLLDPPDTARVSREEVFGPVVCVYSTKNIDDGIARANSVAASFQAAVFTRSIETALRAYARLNGSAVMVNDHTAFRVDWMPFAGLSVSGHGVGGIPATMHEMSIEKMMVLRSNELL
ncbi:MAG: aldehyde dehydrogenase family protein [Alphaproteobacteria bacterium]|nr:aldehyde dehydrogenase family protein [Alphaproteobacteria bacterium]